MIGFERSDRLQKRDFFLNLGVGMLFWVGCVNRLLLSEYKIDLETLEIES